MTKLSFFSLLFSFSIFQLYFQTEIKQLDTSVPSRTALAGDLIWKMSLIGVADIRRNYRECTVFFRNDGVYTEKCWNLNRCAVTEEKQ